MIRSTTSNSVLNTTDAEADSYTQADLDFIAEITSDTDCAPIVYRPSPSRLPLRLRRRHSESAEANLLIDTYSFPWSSFRGTAYQHELVAELDELVMAIESGKDSYMHHRDRYCLLSLTLNSLKQQAPAFRPRPPIPWRADERTAEHMVILRDRIVIDCHWLHCTKASVRATEGKWRGLVSWRKPLDTVRVEDFAATRLTNDYRADVILQLDRMQQAQLAALRGKGMQKAFKDLGAMVTDSSGIKTAARLKNIERLIGCWCSSQPRFEKYYDKYRAYAVAQELLGVAPVNQIARLAGLILGEPPLSDSSARQTMKTLAQIISKGTGT